MEEGHIYPVPEWRVHQGKKKGRWNGARITGQAFGPSAVIWGCCRSSGPGSQTLWAQRKRSADDLNMLNHQVFPSMDFSSLMTQAYSKITKPGLIRLKFWKSGSGSTRRHFHTWLGHQSPVKPRLRLNHDATGLDWERNKLYKKIDLTKCSANKNVPIN